MTEQPRRWTAEARQEAYKELDHPADILLEIWGSDLSELFENALFALYDQVAELEGFDTTHRETIAVHGADPAQALRSLLAEALYRFSTEGFVASRAEVGVETSPEDETQVTAHLNGEILDRRRHTLLSEVKAVTYHQLAVERAPEGGWMATVLFDV